MWSELNAVTLGSASGVLWGNGQGIGVKHPYGFVLAVYLNLVFASDNHSIVLLIPSPKTFSFWVAGMLTAVPALAVAVLVTSLLPA